MSDVKKRVQAALENHHRKLLPSKRARQPKGKTKKPEKLVEAAVLEVAKELGLCLHVVDSSSYDPRTGLKGVSKATPGFPDIVGNTLDGRIVWIELKAKDRRSNLSDAQREFLRTKIQQGCFAVVVDSETKLTQYWKGYSALKSDHEKKAYLYDCLPKQRVRRDRKVDTDLGF